MAREGISPHYLAFALRSLPCLRQLLHLGQGTSSSRRRVEEDELKNLWVPIVPDNEELGKTIATRQECIGYSGFMTFVARLLVEAIIDRKVTEGEMQAAQKALQRGDTSHDRAILSRLIDGGTDAGGTSPLVPDLDALYSAIGESHDAKSYSGERT